MVLLLLYIFSNKYSYKLILTLHIDLSIFLSWIIIQILETTYFHVWLDYMRKKNFEQDIMIFKLNKKLWHTPKPKK